MGLVRQHLRAQQGAPAQNAGRLQETASRELICHGTILLAFASLEVCSGRNRQDGILYSLGRTASQFRPAGPGARVHFPSLVVGGSPDPSHVGRPKVSHSGSRRNSRSILPKGPPAACQAKRIRIGSRRMIGDTSSVLQPKRRPSVSAVGRVRRPAHNGEVVGRVGRPAHSECLGQKDLPTRSHHPSLLHFTPLQFVDYTQADVLTLLHSSSSGAWTIAEGTDKCSERFRAA